MRGEEKLEKYYASDTRKLHRIVGRILSKFGGIYQEDRDNSYPLANKVLAGACQTYDATRSSDGYVHSCLSNWIRIEMAGLNRKKRKAGRMSVSLEIPVGDEEDGTIGNMLMSDFDMERKLAGRL